MRQNYPAFQQRNTEILVIGKDSPSAFKKYWTKEALPFPGLPNPDGSVLKLLGQEFRLLRFGRLPCVLIIDTNGIIRYSHQGSSATDIPSNDDLLQFIDQLISAT